MYNIYNSVQNNYFGKDAKMKIIIRVQIITLLLVTHLLFNGKTSHALGINDVQVIPQNPTISDTISIYSYGWLAYRYAPFDHSDLFIDNYSLQLDIYFGHGHLPATGGWAHTYSCTSVWDFLKRTSISRCDKAGFDALKDPVSVLTDYENFPAHGEVLRRRKV